MKTGIIEYIMVVKAQFRQQIQAVAKMIVALLENSFIEQGLYYAASGQHPKDYVHNLISVSDNDKVRKMKNFQKTETRARGESSDQRGGTPNRKSVFSNQMQLSGKSLEDQVAEHHFMKQEKLKKL